jgi:hypothetical protein
MRSHSQQTTKRQGYNEAEKTEKKNPQNYDYKQREVENETNT